MPSAEKSGGSSRDICEELKEICAVVPVDYGQSRSASNVKNT